MRLSGHRRERAEAFAHPCGFSDKSTPASAHSRQGLTTGSLKEERPVEWQPIETAPRGDGKLAAPKLLLWCPRRGVQIGWYNPDQFAQKIPRPYFACLGVRQSTQIDRADPPTHWAPLPDGPNY